MSRSISIISRPLTASSVSVSKCITGATVEIFHQGARVASHVRSAVKRRHTTTPEHMPSSLRQYADWTPEWIMREAATIGPAMIAPVEAIMKAKAHPEQGFRACNGVLQLAKSCGVTRMEAGGMIGPGDVQWMTAAAGILHEEYHSPAFAAKGGNFEMVQLWVNLPAKDK
jgi:hypothetical protein